MFDKNFALIIVFLEYSSKESHIKSNVALPTAIVLVVIGTRGS